MKEERALQANRPADAARRDGSFYPQLARDGILGSLPVAVLDAGDLGHPVGMPARQVRDRRMKEKESLTEPTEKT